MVFFGFWFFKVKPRLNKTNFVRPLSFWVCKQTKMKIMGNFTHSKVVELCYCDLNVSTANYITNFSRIKKNKGGNAYFTILNYF